MDTFQVDEDWPFMRAVEARTAFAAYSVSANVFAKPVPSAGHTSLRLSHRPFVCDVAVAKA